MEGEERRKRDLHVVEFYPSYLWQYTFMQGEIHAWKMNVGDNLECYKAQ